MNEREDMRALIRLNRAAISMIEVAELSARISEQVLALPEYLKARRVLCYASKQQEVSTPALLREIVRGGRELYLPQVRSHREMAAVRLVDPDALRLGPFGIREPDGGEEIAPGELDLILTPGVAFDRRGGRLGYGAGYFDRFLPKCRGLIVGLAFELQMMDQIPFEPHDVPMDRVITERAVYDCAALRAAK